MTVPVSRVAVSAAMVALVCAIGPQTVQAQPTPLDLDRYVEIVLQAHPAAAQRAGLGVAAGAERQAVRRWADPVVSFSAGRGRLDDPSSTSGAETQFSVAQTIPWPGTYNATVRVGEASATALQAQADGLRWELVADARAAYARLVAARALVEIAQGTEADARSLRNLVTNRADLGEARESDRIKATVEWLRQQRNLATARREADAAEVLVRTLAVAPLPQPLVLAVASVPPVRALRDDLTAEDLVARHPRVLTAEAEVARQRAQLSVATSSRVPSPEVTAFRTGELDKTSAGVAFGFKVPLWNANRGEIARAQAGTLVASADLARQRVDLAAAFAARLRDLQVATSQVSLLEGDLLAAAQRSVDLARFSFEEGETSLLDLLDAQRTLRDTQRELVDARLALAIAVSEAQRLAGPDFTPWK